MSDTSPMLGSTNPEIYKHSGKVPISGLLLAFVILVPAAVVLGIVYSGAVVFVPFIKLRGLVTFFYGGILGALTGLVCYHAKFRSHFFVLLVTLAVAFLSYYVSWAVHAAFVVWSQNGFTEDVMPMAAVGFLPNFIIDWATYIYEEGIWGMGAGGAISGWQVVGLWVLEALIIFGTALAAKSVYGTAPFCEDCNSWTEETKELAQLPVSPADPAWQQFAQGNLDAVKKLQIVQNVPQYVELQLAACPTCANSDFISAVGITLTANKEGEIQKSETDIVRHLRITHAQKEGIQQFAVAMAEAVAEMSGAEDDDPDVIAPAVESTPEDQV